MTEPGSNKEKEHLKKLNKKETQKKLSQLDGWIWSDKKLQKTYSFPDHQQLTTFLRKMDGLSQTKDHYPKAQIFHNSCTLQYSTASVDGVTDLDFSCASALDSGKLEDLKPAPPGENFLTKGAFGLALFLSGFCGISYEVLYSRILSNVMGNHFFVNATILLMFLVGIGLGNKFAHLFSGRLWAVEMGIGLYALFFTLLTPALDTLFYKVASLGMAAQLALSCLLLALPTLLIGFSLPLFAEALQKFYSRRVFALVYMIYNFGAAFTVIATEFYLIRELGIRGTVWLVAAVNLLVGGVLYFFRNETRPAMKKEITITYSQKILISLGLVSVVSAIFQLYMLKIAAFLLGPYQETFAIVLGIVLLGIAVGAVIHHLFKVSFEAFLWINIVYLLLLFLLFEPILFLYASYISGWEGIWIVLWKITILFLIMGVSAICFGAAIPALIQKEENIARESGQLLFVSCMANGTGYLLMVLFLHETFTYGQILFLLVALLCVALFIYTWKSKVRLLPLAASGALAAVLLTQVWKEDLLYLSYMSFTSPQKLKSSIIYMEGHQTFRKYDEVFAINTIDGEKYFFINGYISIALGSHPEYLVGVLSSLVSPKTEEALVLGLGSGATAGTVAEIFDSVDVVEISPAIVEQQSLMKEYNFDISRKKNVHIEVDDGIRFVKGREKKYDLILNTVTTPLYFSSSKLYTQDFFQDVVSKLKKDGVYVTWINSRVGEKGLSIILSTLKKEFQHCWLAGLTYGYSLLVCSNSPLSLRQEKKIYANKILQDFFERHGKDLSLSRYAFISNDAYGVLNVSEESPLNTLDLPGLEFEMARIASKADQKSIHLNNLYKYLVYNYDLNKMNEKVFENPHLDMISACSYYFQIDKQENFFYKFFLNVLQRHLPKEKQSELLLAIQKRNISYYESLVKKHPTPRLTADLAEVYIFCREYGKARQLLEEECKKNPDNKELNWMLALISMRKGDFQKALAIGEGLLKKYPYNTQVMAGMAESFMGLGRHKEAIPWLKKVLELNPQFQNGHTLLGLCYLETKEMDLAFESFRKEMEINPENRQAEEYLYTSMNAKKKTP